MGVQIPSHTAIYDVEQFDRSGGPVPKSREPFAVLLVCKRGCSVTLVSAEQYGCSCSSRITGYYKDDLK